VENTGEMRKFLVKLGRRANASSSGGQSTHHTFENGRGVRRISLDIQVRVSGLPVYTESKTVLLSPNAHVQKSDATVILSVHIKKNRWSESIDKIKKQNKINVKVRPEKKDVINISDPQGGATYSPMEGLPHCHLLKVAHKNASSNRTQATSHGDTIFLDKKTIKV
jgi:hypothetical protein